MRQIIRICIIKFGCQAFIFIALFSAVVSVSSAPDPEANALQKHYYSCRQALSHRQWDSYWKCLTEDAQTQLLTASYMGAAIHVSIRSSLSTDKITQKLEQQFNSLRQKYGIGDSATEEEFYKFIQYDTRRFEFYLELMEYLEEIHKLNQKSSGEEKKKRITKIDKSMELTNITISGERAEATLIYLDRLQEEEQRIVFKKVNGKWLIDLPRKIIGDRP